MATAENPLDRDEQIPEPGAASNGAGDPLGWQRILAAMAAAAGSAAWVSAVGSAVMGARLDNAGMPIESVVSLMPAEQRFAIGVGHLLAPLFVGLLGFLVDWALTAQRNKTIRDRPREERTPLPLWARRFARPALAVATILIGAWIGDVLLEPPSETLYAMQLVAIVVAVGTVWWFGPTRGTSASERGAVFLLVLVLAGVIAFGFEVRQDPQFDFAAVRFQDSDEAPVAGYYVTTTSASVLLITLGHEDDPQRCPDTTELGRISALAVSDIDTVWIGPREETFDTDAYCSPKKLAPTMVAP
jgi:hypothetical protein